MYGASTFAIRIVWKSVTLVLRIKGDKKKVVLSPSPTNKNKKSIIGSTKIAKKITSSNRVLIVIDQHWSVQDFRKFYEQQK
jgi:hypothetical protein